MEWLWIVASVVIALGVAFLPEILNWFGKGGPK
jgi:hypothetical protein